MYAVQFDPKELVIHVRLRIWGPARDSDLLFVFDTGTKRTVVDTAAIDALGYGASMGNALTTLTGVDGKQQGYRLKVDRFDALGMSLEGFNVFCHDFDETLGIDGLIGMDFIAGRVVTIDNVLGLLKVES